MAVDNKKFLDMLKRGVTETISEEELLKKLSVGKPLRIKLGVDPTAPDLHLGHTVLLRKLKQFQDAGHTIVFIIGDLTARIGDPSGQDRTRPMMSEKEIMANANTYQQQVFKILDKDKTEVAWNSHWLYPLGLHGMLDLARRSTVAQMLHRADFKERYRNDVDITILEFLYPLIQGYDSVAIRADVELGGTDQKFNLLMGRQIQKEYGQQPQVVMLMPLIVGTDGEKKMSKSYGNYISLNEDPKDMYGKIMSLPDGLMSSYYELLTEFDMEQVKNEIKLSPRDAKGKLAFYISQQYHGIEQAKRTAEEFEKVFSKKELPSEQEIPSFRADKKRYKLSDLLVKCSLAPSKNEARRLISQGAVEIDNERVKEDTEVVVEKQIILRAGKHRFCRVIPS